MDETTTIMWDTLQSHEVMAELYKNEIKRHPSITPKFVRFLVTANIVEPLQEIYQIKRYIEVLSTKSDNHHGILDNLEE